MLRRYLGEQGRNAWISDEQAFQLEVNTATELLGAKVLSVLEEQQKPALWGPGRDVKIPCLSSPTGFEAFSSQFKHPSCSHDLLSL